MGADVDPIETNNLDLTKINVFFTLFTKAGQDERVLFLFHLMADDQTEEEQKK